MHEWYLEHVIFLVHVILPVCFEKFYRGSYQNQHESSCGYRTGNGEHELFKV